ncbi:MAG: flagellar basal body L-ring protein [Pseudomonadales bacterium]|nr:flagellar basal body L-ring protein [Pseudomonadales bacterium]
MTKKIGYALTISGLGFFLAACHVPSKSIEASPDDPKFAPVYVRSPVVSPTPTGSIYRDGFAVDLYQRRAHRVGDILTVVLNESTTASKSSNTTFSKTNDSSVSDQTVAGNGFLGTGIELNGSVSSSVDFSGEADAGISNQLSGSITVSVAGVLPNGVLEVRGEKWLELSRGNEFIRISGLVRKEDITPENMVDSTRIADVRIAYSETGELANANRASWLSRFFVSDVWPF